ncbi:LysR family transcriptional regulator [Centipeda periodontii DSM 2778]|uniref:LysR family transcriptional regulator n=1 Tax=Centipeda periodontii DSM 2778 TaxID=888060 RepID=F5RPH5_9FIRM|nr:LysR family transcriptional regulator [Centipeda periodontii]EGK57643.1 LysR family transcriptional regulator [Centipeda periodontii DSM 2778]
MELAQLKYFQVMANIRHFTRAARMLDVTQPALSRSMAKLEKDLDVPLFKRSEGEIELTPEGERLLRRVDRILREVDSAREEASNAHAEVSKEFRLSFIHSLGSYALPHILQDFRALYPDIRIQLNQQDSAALALQVAAGETDLCLCSTIPTTEYSAWVYLWSEELFVTVPLGHRFAEREKINLQELEDEPLVAMKSSYSLRILVDQFFDLAGIHPEITFEGDDVSTISGLVAAGLGVSLLPKLAGVEHPELRYIPVSFPICKRAVGIAWNTQRQLPPAAICFQQFLIRRFDNTMKK